MKTVIYPDVFTKQDYRDESPEEINIKIEALIRRMTVDEKCRMLGGQMEPSDKGKIGNAGYQWGVPRLGIPETVMYDGPAGITGIVDTTGLPQPSLLGCTWDDEMAYRFGEAAASELNACSGNFLLAPQVDVIRTPHFERNKDMKSEDSYMAARMAAQETKAVQDQHGIATLKHFAAANIRGGEVSGSVGSVVDEQTLHEIYLRPFEAGIREGGAGSVMCAYNVVNAAFCSANTYLLKDVLRDMWNFKGCVMSDWGAVHEFTLNKGLDIEMPYAAYNDQNRVLKKIRSGECSWKDLDQAVRHVLYAMGSAGLLSLVQLDEDGNVCDEPGRTKPIQMEWHYEEAVRSGLPEKNAQIAAQICREGIVLARNENSVLPLSKEDMDGLLLLGPGAKYPVTGERQERSFGRLERMLSGQEAMEELTGKQIRTEVGIDYCGTAIPAACLFQDADCTQPGLVRTYGILPEDRARKVSPFGPGGAGDAFFGEVLRDEDGEEIHTGLSDYETSGEHYPADYPLGKFAAIDAQIDFTCGTDENGNVVKNYRNAADGSAFADGAAYTWKGYLKAPEDGEYTLLIEAIGGEGCFFIQTEDGNWIMVGSASLREWTQWPWDTSVFTSEGMDVVGKKVVLQASHAYPIIVFGRQAVRNKDLQIRAAWSTPSFKRENYERALQAARAADTIVFFAGTSHDAEDFFADSRAGKFEELDISEEHKTFLQDVSAIKKTETPLIVVLQTSNAKAVSHWINLCDALLITYLPGQEGSRVIAEILTGRTNPSGKLNQTWPKKRTDTAVSDTPAHYETREKGISIGNGKYTNYYDEGIFTGYRWCDKNGVEPQFPFGYGLSYTTFSYDDLKIAETDSGFEVSFNVANTGECAGDEVVQLYLGAAEVPAYIQMAQKQLAGYARVRDLKPGEIRRICIPITERSLCFWDPAIGLQERPDGTKDKWRKAVGSRKVYIGASSRDIRLEGTIFVK